MAKPRVAAGALFVDDEDRVLLVKPTYKQSWDIPGGYVEPGESPYQACIREVREELGIAPEIGRLLVVDWAPNDAEGDKILFVFDGGGLTDNDIAQITLQDSELLEYNFFRRSKFVEHLTGRLARRVGAACDARHREEVHYLEHGRSLRTPGADLGPLGSPP
jgi:ADP-ribose pyrophosphatase YjhB (NUDIX family)